MRTSKHQKKFMCLSDEVSQKDLFDKFYSDFYTLLEEFVESVYDNGDARLVREKLIGFIIDMYSESFLEEVSYILDELALPVTQQELIVIQNSLDTSSFIISNRGRVRDILIEHESKILEKIELTGLPKDEFVAYYAPAMTRLAISEVHMSIEKASVQGSKLLQEIVGVKLNKVWNCVGDKNSCKTCLALDGTAVPVDEPFIDTFTGIYVGLEYTGGDFTYAHPQCRCWLTYEQA